MPHRLGSGHGRPLYQSSMAGPSFLLAHKLPRNASGVPSSEEFPARPQRDREVDPVNCPVASVLEFVQDRFSAGLTPSTLKVYMAAIAAFHAPLGDGPLGRHQLVVRFLRGARTVRPVARTRVPTWDLAVVLEGLVEAPFEPLPGYVTKVPSNVARPTVLQAFHPPPHVTADEERLNLLCPVRALRIYVQRSSSWWKSDQLLVCFGSPKKGLPASKQTISNWIVQDISMAYQMCSLPSPLAVRAHSTRGMASSRATVVKLGYAYPQGYVD
ncbi:hypothetical protein PO909_012986 [Leuciscus waleckii]